MRQYKSKKGKYKGVSFNNGSWKADVFNGSEQKIYMGTYGNKDEARIMCELGRENIHLFNGDVKEFRKEIMLLRVNKKKLQYLLRKIKLTGEISLEEMMDVITYYQLAYGRDDIAYDIRKNGKNTISFGESIKIMIKTLETTYGLGERREVIKIKGN